MARARVAAEASDRDNGLLLPGQRDPLEAGEDSGGGERDDGDAVTVWEAAEELGVCAADVVYAASAGWLAEVGEREVAGHPAAVYRVGEVRALPHRQPQVGWDRDVRDTTPGSPRMLREWTAHGGYRAHSAARLAQQVAERWGVATWARWRPSGGWLLDWAPGPDGAPDAEEVAGELGDQVLVVGGGEHRQRVELLSRSGEVTHWAHAMLQPGIAAVVDCETTSLTGHAVEVAVLDAATGEVLMETLVRPPEPITPGAQRVHRISNEMVAGAPELPDVWPQLVAATHGRTVLAYHADFDRGILGRGAIAADLTPRRLGTGWECLMRARSAWEGTTSRSRLEGSHRAAGDCRAAREWLVRMAGAPLWWGPATATPARQTR